MKKSILILFVFSIFTMSCKKQQQDLEQASQIEIGSLVRNYILAKESEVDVLFLLHQETPLVIEIQEFSQI